MTLAILATGDELVHGDTLNTNSHVIAHTLSSEGIPLGFHMTCSDKEADIINALTFLTESHNTVIIIGGLGPTSDDRTRFALAHFTNEPLVQHKEALDHIHNRLGPAKVVINEGNLQQALFPQKATILPNPNGSAVGCYYLWNNTHFFLLPGPPWECLPMFDNYVLPIVRKEKHSDKHILKWRIFGLAESEIGQTLEDALAGVDCKTGYRLDVPYIEFKVRCTENNLETIKSIIDPILKPHIICGIDNKASDLLRELIIKNNEAITIIDDVTGGVLQSTLINPETYPVLSFHNKQKTSLHFHLSGLSEYWAKEKPSGQSQLVIHYSNHNQEGREVHEIPFRSPLVIHYAVEWLSFRLFHLINQLHQ